jgi:ABC-type nitrate/sulfonate/bicarbonate transport system permease component
MSHHHRRHHHHLNKWVIRIVTFFAVIAGWQVFGSSVNSLFVSTPIGVVDGFAVLLSGVGQYSLVDATVVTLESMFAGFLISAAVGILLGLAMGMWRSVDVALNPYVNALYVTPRIALIPLIIIWFGIGFNAITFTVFLTAVFPVLINTVYGVKNISKEFLDTADMFMVHGMQRFRKVIFPALAPFIMSGLRNGLAQAFIGVVVAEMVLALQGLGFLVVVFGEYFDTSQLIATLLVLMVIGAALTSVLQFLEGKIGFWKESERAFQ